MAAVFAAVAGGNLNAAEGEPVVHADLPSPISLNGEWAFQLAENAEVAQAWRKFHEPDFDASGFDTLPVPSHWSLHGFEDPLYVNGSEAEGFYRYEFEAPESAKDLRAMLHFGGVWVSAEVWLNGENLGRHDSGFTAFAFDVSDELKPGEKNLLTVRVRQQIPASLFKFDANDDWGLAGIYRDVHLEFSPKHLYIGSVEVTTDLDEAYIDADLGIRVFVNRNERDHYIAPSAPFELRATLMERDGEKVQELVKTITVAGAHNGRDTLLNMRVREPRLWTAETPELYRLRVEIVRNEQVVHRWEDTIGFREVSTEGGVLRVNGQLVKLRGVASHDLHPDVGRATTREHWLKDITLMKEANINAVRLAHYPHAEGFIRLCDEMGLYVLNEIPLGFGGDRMADPIFASGMLLRIHETIQRDRNRPSVIVWNFGNEDGLTYLHTVGLRAIKGIDPTRPVLLPFRAEPELPPEVDILAPHYWTTEEYDRIGATATRPVVTTEYTHAMGERGVGELEHRWKALTAHPAGAGAMIWLWADQGLKRTVDGRPVYDPMDDKDKYTREGGELVRLADAGPDAIIDAHGNYGTDGIVNADRSLTRDYLEAKGTYAPVEVLIKSLQLQPGQDMVRIPLYNGYDFTDLEETTINWTLYRDNVELASGTEQPEAGPHMTAELSVPLEGINPEGVYYVDLQILRPDGGEMTRESVRLLSPPTPALVAGDHPSPEVREDGSLVTVTAGKATYVFDRESGEIQSVSDGATRLAGTSNLVVWRRSTYNERNRYDRRENQHDWKTYMQGLDGRAQEFDLSREDGSVLIRAVTLYELDELNKATAEYTYRVTGDGSLRVDMTVRPEMDVPELPEVGIVMDIPRQLERLAWLGEGPGYSVPGKTAGTRFGWWAFDISSPDVFGTKSGLDWARLFFGPGHVLRVVQPDGIRLEKAGEAYQFRILTRLGGEWTKNGPPERDEWHLDLENNDSFSGSFTLSIE